MIKHLPEEFKVQFECSGENTEKCITFSVLIKKKLIMMVVKKKKMMTMTIKKVNNHTQAKFY